jgi:hypothetical protein
MRLDIETTAAIGLSSFFARAMGARDSDSNQLEVSNG